MKNQRRRQCRQRLGSYCVHVGYVECANRQGERYDLPSRSVQLCRSKEAQRVSQQGQLTALVAVRPDSSG
ncbi:hypothetical protein HWD95_01925 [Pseudomonas corrugata]|nr:hypothetical protein [Pseudomonas corrugata]NUT65371.1 hypothetical protein [Pseudomonas corrugata]